MSFKDKHDFRTKLLARLRQRDDTASGAYYLDLRNHRFGMRGIEVLHHTADPRWPLAGATTQKKDEAEDWTSGRYTDWLWAELGYATGPGQQAGLTVREAGLAYLAKKARVLGPDHHTVVNRESQFRTHIEPALGDMPMHALDSYRVRTLLETLMVKKPDGKGGFTKKPAELSTRRNLRTTILAIWRATYPDREPPFAGIQLEDEEEYNAQRREEDDDLEALLSPQSGAMTPEKVRRALVAAVWYDTVHLSRPNLRRTAVPNTAFIIAILIATGMRVGELLMLRWDMILWDEDCIVVRWNKRTRRQRRKRPVRVVPLQAQLRPWLEELRRMEEEARGGPLGKAYVIRTDARMLSKPPAKRTLMNRVAEVLTWAGLKVPKKATHWARATHATFGSGAANVLTTEELKAYLGHAVAYGGATDDYVQTMKELMRPEHRTYIRHLPSPEATRAALADFQPVDRDPWKDRVAHRKSRTPEALASTKARRRKQR